MSHKFAESDDEDKVKCAVINGTEVKCEGDVLWSYVKWGTSNQHKWRVLKGSINWVTGYKSAVVKGRSYYFHRIIYKLHNPEWDIDFVCKTNKIDHRDGNKLNNSIENLRRVTQQENTFNRTCLGYSTYETKTGVMYKAQITLNQKLIYLGAYSSAEEAREAYLTAKKIYHVFKEDADVIEEVPKTEQEVCSP